MSCLLIALFLILELSSYAKGIMEEFIKSFIRMFPMLFAASIAVVLKLMVQSKRQKITPWTAIISWFSGVGSCYLCYPAILKHSTSELVPLWLALVVLIGDRVITYIVEKLHVELFLTSAINWLIEKAKRLIP